MIAKKPPMGWNSWNTFGDKINEQLIKEMADRIVEDGYRDLGYEYIIIDFGNDYADNRPFFLLSSIKIVIGNLSWWKLQHYVAFIAATEKEQSRKHWKFLGTVSSERTIRYMGKRMRTAIRPVPYEPDPFFLTGETMSFLQELLE